eukprot:Protomagalhaensia_sp_Gyna_25__3145@NODE_287_length_4041_cov_106_612694_g221_i0_p5_GENE_NODE_287_length_4041_cov_106_612694_g221_i0NODE_287_length_4041_cov_106_612694_g221_i0_p5_ORF_typecomplete_len120_score7_23_NODE_287_length_4041_cov_106_612694_g221_i025122871
MLLHLQFLVGVALGISLNPSLTAIRSFNQPPYDVMNYHAPFPVKPYSEGVQQMMSDMMGVHLAVGMTLQRNEDDSKLKNLGSESKRRLSDSQSLSKNTEAALSLANIVAREWFEQGLLN